MMTTLIVEDNLTQLEALRNVLAQTFPTMQFLYATNYDTAKSIIETESIHFFLLDIELIPGNHEKDGINLGTYIRSIPKYKHTPILFLTARIDQIEIALNKTHCYNYLVKPYQYETLIESIHDLLDAPFLRDTSSIALKDINGIFFRINPENLCCIQSSSKSLILTCENGEMTTRQYTLEQLLCELPTNFCQCHKRYIINCHKVISYDKTSQIVHIGSFSNAIPIGRKYKKDFERILSDDNHIC